MLMKFKALSKTFYGRHMWARGYFVEISGNVTDELLIKYIEQQVTDLQMVNSGSMMNFIGFQPKSKLPPSDGSSSLLAINF